MYCHINVYYTHTVELQYLEQQCLNTIELQSDFGAPVYTTYILKSIFLLYLESSYLS